MIFLEFLGVISLFKIAKKVVYLLAGHAELMWHGVEHVAEPREPMRMLAWRGHVAHGRHVAGPHEPTRTFRWCLHGMSDRLECDGPMGIVGPGYSIGAVTQMR